MVESLNCAMLTKTEDQSIVSLHTEQECMYARLNTQEARKRCHHPGICPFLLVRYLLVRWSKASGITSAVVPPIAVPKIGHTLISTTENDISTNETHLDAVKEF